MALLLQVTMVQIAGSADRIYVSFGISYELQIWFWRIAAVVIPILGFFIARAICRRLPDRGPPAGGWTGTAVDRSLRALEPPERLRAAPAPVDSPGQQRRRATQIAS